MKRVAVDLAWALFRAPSALAVDNGDNVEKDGDRRVWQHAAIRKIPIAYPQPKRYRSFGSTHFYVTDRNRSFHRETVCS